MCSRFCSLFWPGLCVRNSDVAVRKGCLSKHKCFSAVLAISSVREYLL